MTSPDNSFSALASVSGSAKWYTLVSTRPDGFDMDLPCKDYPYGQAGKRGLHRICKWYETKMTRNIITTMTFGGWILVLSPNWKTAWKSLTKWWTRVKVQNHIMMICVWIIFVFFITFPGPGTRLGPGFQAPRCQYAKTNITKYENHAIYYFDRVFKCVFILLQLFS
jgi:hypothetical protein